LRKASMKIISKWNEAPPPVKWTSLLWLLIGVAGIAFALYSLLTFLRLPVTGMTGLIVIEVGLRVSVATLIVFAVWKFLSGAPWSRAALEIASWVTLVYYSVIGATWIGSAVLNWDEFKASVVGELPQVEPGFKLITGAFIYVALIAICAVVIKALRSASARRFVKQQT